MPKAVIEHYSTELPLPNYKNEPILSNTQEQNTAWGERNILGGTVSLA